MQPPSRSRKIFAAILSAFAIITFLGTLQELFWQISFTGSLISGYLFSLNVIIIIVVSSFVTLRWPKAYTVIDAIIRYWLAFEISLYGFAKIFHSQFSLPAYMTDVPASSLTGFELTWYFFGYSYSFAVIIAIIQIAGAALLAINRTKIAGALILLPVMMNIVLINIFYDIAPGAFINSVLFVTGLLYIIMPQTAALIKAILPETPRQKTPRVYFQIFISATIGIVAGYFMYKAGPAPQAKISGKWEVRSLKFGTDSLVAEPTFSWKNIYIENTGEIIFCSNASIYSPSESIYGGYRYDDKSSKMKILFENGYSEPDSVPVIVRHLGPDEFEWTFSFQQKPVSLQLKKILLHN